MSVESTITAMAKSAKTASFEMARCASTTKNDALLRIADRIEGQAPAIMKENEYRGLDLFTPVWNMLDLTPDGRGDWLPGLQYD